MDKTTATKIFEILSQTIPNPQTELQYKTPFELLVAVILSAQATDVSVNKVTANLFKIANTPEKLLVLGKAKLINQIKTIGLYQAKATYLLKTAQILSEKHNSQIPNTREQLEALPGVGRKTANIILNIIFKQPTIGVDTHVFRVCNRLGLAPGKTPRQVEEKLLKIVPEKYLHTAHHLLILHGRYICTARNPHCLRCPLCRLCEFVVQKKAR